MLNLTVNSKDREILMNDLYFRNFLYSSLVTITVEESCISGIATMFLEAIREQSTFRED